MLRKCNSLVIADAVINYLQNDSICLDHLQGIKGSIESYQNGREHGYTIWALNNNGQRSEQCFYICLGRSTDRITIYQGSYTMQGLTDDAYQNPKTFNTHQAYAAALWLSEKIKNLF